MTGIQNPIRVILFDLGYTLIYFDGDFGQKATESYLTLANSLIRQGCQIDAVRFSERFETIITQYYHEREKDLIEKPVLGFIRQVLAEFNQDHLPAEIYRQALDDMYTVTEVHWKVEEDTLPTLEALKKSGYRLGIISNAADAQDAANLVDQNHLRSYFETIVISADIGWRKPDARIFAHTLNQLGAKSDETVLVGDTLGADILGAHRAGMRGIWITRRSENPRNNALRGSITPDAEIATLAELPGVLDRWNK